MGFFLTLLLLVVTLGFTWRYLGSYMRPSLTAACTFSASSSVRSTDARYESGTRTDLEAIRRRAGRLLCVSLVFTYVILRIQDRCP